MAANKFINFIQYQDFHLRQETNIESKKKTSAMLNLKWIYHYELMIKQAKKPFLSTLLSKGPRSNDTLEAMNIPNIPILVSTCSLSLKEPRLLG
jgi:hypothetical protein